MRARASSTCARTVRWCRLRPFFQSASFAAVGGFAVGDDHLGVAAVGAVSHDRPSGQLGCDAGGAVDDGVVAVSGLGVAERHHEVGVGVGAIRTFIDAYNARCQPCK